MRVEEPRSSVVSVSSNKSSVTVSFAEHFTRSEQFDQIFRSGMELVEATASYLDGAGRAEAKALSPTLAVVYASESMRLTTRLLELASWLLIRRAIKTGEMSVEEARVKRRRLRLSTIGRPGHVASYDHLPQKLRALIETSFAMNDRIVQLDQALERPAIVMTRARDADPVGSQIAKIAAAFGAHERAPH